MKKPTRIHLTGKSVKIAERGLLEWCRDNLSTVYVFDDEVEIAMEHGGVLKKDTSRQRKLALGLITSNSPEEFYAVSRQLCPVGTIIKPYMDEAERWAELYTDKLRMAEIVLTSALLDERKGPSAKILITLLERRSRRNWGSADQKGLEVKTKEGVEVKFTL
ncbi:MAG: hypothetical protein HUK20_04605 [Fibrobacter sp.]|nr:hypothetical protein [Fibrobacter sp.]